MNFIREGCLPTWTSSHQETELLTQSNDHLEAHLSQQFFLDVEECVFAQNLCVFALPAPGPAEAGGEGMGAIRGTSTSSGMLLASGPSDKFCLKS